MTVAHRPTTVEQAVAIINDHPDAIMIAGCTDLMASGALRDRPHVVDLTRIDELRVIAADADGIEVGAGCTFSDIQRHAAVRASLPALAAAAATVGGWQIQNRATIGGNVVNASPAGDSLPVLLALDAEVELAGPTGRRRVSYAAFHESYRQTALRPGELICRFRMARDIDRVQGFRKVGTREAQAISKVVVACSARRAADGTLDDVRIAAGSVAPTPIRLARAEHAVEGRAPDVSCAAAAAAAAVADASPIDDVRSTARYRSWVLGNVVRRLILGLDAG